MKTLSIALVSLFAVAAFANEPAQKPAATTPTPTATAPAAAPAAKPAKMAHTDCEKMTDAKAKEECMKAAKKH